MIKRVIAGSLSLSIGGIGIIYAAMEVKTAARVQDAFNLAFLALTMCFIAVAASQLFAPGNVPSREPAKVKMLTAPKNWFASDQAMDLLAMLVPLFCLVGMIALALTYPNQTVYPASGTGYEEGDYYRYINMSFDHGDPRYVFAQPFLYRVLVPSTVHVLSDLGVPFRAGFFSITCVTLGISTIALFFLARGAGLSRFAASSTALIFTLLFWTVTYNISDYFLIDTTTEAFIVTMVLCVQRRRFLPVIVLGTIGVACKETVYLPIAFAAIHLILPHLSPLSATLGQIARLRFGVVARKVPLRNWLMLGPLLVCPFIVTLSLRHFIPLANPKPLSVLWPIYLQIHINFGIVHTIASSLWYTFGIMIFLALGAMALRLWPRAGWSGWGLLTVLLIIIYSYSLSGDSQRLSIIAWPFVLVLAALMINEIARQLRVSEILLWPAVVLLLLLNFPPYPGLPHFDNVTYLGTRLLPQTNYWPQIALLLLITTIGILLIVGYLLYHAMKKADTTMESDDVSTRETVLVPPVAGSVFDPASTNRS